MPRPSRVLVALLALVATLVVAGCGGSPVAGVPDPVGLDEPAAPTASAPVGAAPSQLVDGAIPSDSPGPSTDPLAALCPQLATIQARLTQLAALELRPTARVSLDIELSRVQAAFSDMRQDATDTDDPGMDDTLRRLGYRLDDLALAVEDFRTTSRPRDASKHVETEAAAFADALAGFQLQSGC
jgi:hypothetical protein